jgi:hypothetical protein
MDAPIPLPRTASILFLAFLFPDLIPIFVIILLVMRFTDLVFCVFTALLVVVVGVGAVLVCGQLGVWGLAGILVVDRVRWGIGDGGVRN